MSDYNQPLDSGIGGSSSLEITPRNYTDLRSSSKWAKLLAIGHFVGVGFMVLTAIVMLGVGASFSEQMGMMGGGALMAFFYLIYAGILVMPGLFLWRFAGNTTQALETNDQLALQDSLGNLSSLFKFYGVIMLISLVFMGIGLVFALMGGLFAAFV